MESGIHTKDAIVLSTIKLLSEVGLHSLTTKKVAEQLGISEAAIFKHFKSKNEILIAVLNYFSQHDKEIIISIRDRKISSVQEIIEFIGSLLSFYESYPEVSVIVHSYEGLMRNASLAQVVENIIDYRFNFIKTIVQEGKEQGEISRNVDSEGLAEIIFGLERFIILRWRMDNFGFPLKEHAVATLKMLLAYLQDNVKIAIN